MILNNFLKMEAKDVIEIRKKLNLTQEGFAEQIGVSKNTVYNWENGSKIPDSRAKMLKSYIHTGKEKLDDFNYEEDKLITEGKQDQKSPPLKIPKLGFSQEITGFYYPDVKASAGLETAFNNSEITKIPVSIPNFGHEIDFINVYGDSMYPKYCSGEIIGIKEIEPQYVNYGYAYVVIMGDGEVYLKYIKKGSDKDHLLLASENPRYEPKEFHLSLIRNIFIIKGVITKTTM